MSAVPTRDFGLNARHLARETRVEHTVLAAQAQKRKAKSRSLARTLLHAKRAIESALARDDNV